MKNKIIIAEWDHTCGDGCCYTYGTDVYINEVKVTSGDYNDLQTIMQEVLDYLGYNFELEKRYNI